MSEKRAKLATLERRLADDRTLPLAATANLVFGEGDPDATIMFIGEAPGFHENELRRPFVGRAGKLLDQMLTSIALPRERVYITNIVKRRPPDNRDPLPEEIAAYEPFLAEQIAIIAPKLIATLGRFSMNYFLPLAKISRDHGTLIRHANRLLFPLYHPAAALRSTAVLGELESDFRKIPNILRDIERLLSPPPLAPLTQAKGTSQNSLFA